MPLPDNTADTWKQNPVQEEGNTYDTILSIAGTRVPEGFIEDIFETGNELYGKENLNPMSRRITWEQISQGVWQIKVGKPL